MDELIEQAAQVVYCLRAGEVSYAYRLYPTLLNMLVAELDMQQLTVLKPLLTEMLKAQEEQNTVWLADLIEYILLERMADS